MSPSSCGWDLGRWLEKQVRVCAGSVKRCGSGSVVPHYSPVTSEVQGAMGSAEGAVGTPGGRSRDSDAPWPLRLCREQDDVARPQLGGPFPGGGNICAKRSRAALTGSRALKVIDRVIKYLLSTYYVPGAILRRGKQRRVKQRPLGPPCSGTWEPGSIFLIPKTQAQERK